MSRGALSAVQKTLPLLMMVAQSSSRARPRVSKVLRALGVCGATTAASAPSSEPLGRPYEQTRSVVPLEHGFDSAAKVACPKYATVALRIEDDIERGEITESIDGKAAAVKRFCDGPASSWRRKREFKLWLWDGFYPSVIVRSLYRFRPRVVYRALSTGIRACIGVVAVNFFAIGRGVPISMASGLRTVKTYDPKFLVAESCAALFPQGFPAAPVRVSATGPTQRLKARRDHA